MSDIKIFKCTANELDVISSDIIAGLSVNYEEANKKAEYMAELSCKIKESKKLSYCRLPFCHTVEAEALGAEVIFDSLVGNRIGKYKIQNISDIELLKAVDFSKGRVAEVLSAITMLKSRGEKVVVDVSGPISIATSIMDSRLFYRGLRKDKAKINICLELIEKVIIQFMKETIKRGVDMISFADPTGTIDIVGPKMYRQVAGDSVYKILKAVKDNLQDTVIHVCGKTSTSLEAIGLIESEKITIDPIQTVKNRDYFHMIEKLKTNNPDIKFIGHWCLKLNIYKSDKLTVCRLKE